VLNLIGDAGSKKPVIPLNLVADYAGASLHGALGIVLALFARERHGRGQHVDISYLDTTLSLLAATPNMRFFFSDGVAPARGEGFLGGSYPYYAIYETRDNKLLTIGCTEPWLWENFCKAIGGRTSRVSRASPTSSCAPPTPRRRPPAMRSRPSSARATATTGTSSSSSTTCAWARSTTSRRWCAIPRSTTAA
jgi:crotonobetainyl-CoA:carnitine CoA-transferase CaiB-like acyl-CoA transferase